MATAFAIHFFDIWRPKYGGNSVTVKKASDDTNATLYDGPDTGTAGTLSNPQTLDSATVSDVLFGKWQQPVYVTEDVYLSIDGADETGIIKVPLTTLVGADASQATVTLSGQSTAVAIRSAWANVVWAGFFGTLSGTATQTTATINAAIGQASSNGGGLVLLPAGEFTVDDTLSLPAGVRIRGQGRGVTTIKAQMGQDLIAISNARSGLEELTLDGVNKTASSVGVEIDDASDVAFDQVEIKNFVIGLDAKAVQESVWRNLFISACTTGVDLNTESGASDLIRDIKWIGGQVELCTTVGVNIEHTDEWVHSIRFIAVNFDDNTGTALRIRGAQYVSMDGCHFNGNTTLFDFDDVAAPSGDKDDIIVGFRCTNFFIDQGAATFVGTCSQMVFENGEVTAGTWTFTSVDSNILFVDVTEGTSFALAGTTTRLLRRITGQDGYTTGQTTGSSATKAWAITLLPGQVAMCTAQVTAVRQDGDAYATFRVEAGARRPPSTLDYDTQTANFTAGATLTGGTSGATATIVQDDDAGTTGTLHLINIVGEFENNETITDGSGGSALANGTLTAQDVVAGKGIRSDIGLIFGNDRTISADFAASSEEIEFQVTGASSETWDWTVKIDAIVSG